MTHQVHHVHQSLPGLHCRSLTSPALHHWSKPRSLPFRFEQPDLCRGYCATNHRYPPVRLQAVVGLPVSGHKKLLYLEAVYPWVAVLRRIVPDLQPWKPRKDLAGAGGTHGLLRLRIDGNGMGREDRDAYRGWRNREVWQLQDLAYLVDKFL